MANTGAQGLSYWDKAGRDLGNLGYRIITLGGNAPGTVGASRDELERAIAEQAVAKAKRSGVIKTPEQEAQFLMTVRRDIAAQDLRTTLDSSRGQLGLYGAPDIPTAAARMADVGVNSENQKALGQATARGAFDTTQTNNNLREFDAKAKLQKELLGGAMLHEQGIDNSRIALAYDTRNDILNYARGENEANRALIRELQPSATTKLLGNLVNTASGLAPLIALFA